MRGASFITVILIVGIFGVFFFAVSKVVDPFDYYYKFQDETRKADLAKIQVALEKYYVANSQYPKNSGNGSNPCIGDNLIKFRNPNTQEVESVLWGTKWFGYLEPLPKDANGDKCYVYDVSPTLQSYWIYASLDRGAKDEKACSVAGVQCNHMIGNNLVAACHKTGTSEKYNCNYGLSSANESL